jgi:hypothetical protein
MGMKRGGATLRLALLWAFGCGSDAARLTVGYVPGPELDASTPDASDAGGKPGSDSDGQDAQGTCDLPEGVSLPEEISAEVRGDGLAPIVYYAGGAPLPRGRYRVSYVKGCFSCCVTLLDNFWLVGEDIFSLIATLPGGSAEGLDIPPVASCPVVNAPYPELEFEFAGGKLGVWLSDAVAIENIDGDGEGGPNPTWRLTLLEACP